VELAWLWIALALVGAAAGVFLGLAVKGRPAKQRIGAWISIALGVAFFLVYVTKVDRDVFTLVLGLVCTLVGAHALEVERLHERIGRLQDEVRERGSPRG
jgi:hypothetical protein